MVGCRQSSARTRAKRQRGGGTISGCRKNGTHTHLHQLWRVHDICQESLVLLLLSARPQHKLSLSLLLVNNVVRHADPHQAVARRRRSSRLQLQTAGLAGDGLGRFSSSASLWTRTRTSASACEGWWRCGARSSGKSKGKVARHFKRGGAKVTSKRNAKRRVLDNAVVSSS
jgi:hypothetical protein